ncbi:MAG: HAMP domain-containing histidine kinase [Oscillospiraceae bacterium]|nr:HAMP domain-containing histidine kinase [Oscillospiraceae bacterium]
MKIKLIFITVLFSLAVILLSGWIRLSSKGDDPEDERAAYIVDLNEISRLNESGEHETANARIAALQENMRKAEIQKSGANAIPVLCGVSVLFFVTAFGYIYFAILRPFDKLKDFAAKISLGDFDVPLKYERSNYFGEFTWAFDSMRNEITKSRASEKEAIENNKTVIATLSHDIKTPIASIRAYAEGLSANMDSSYEKREKYLSVITKKCDEVSRLTNDLFLHSVSDMDKLKLVPERIEICVFTKSIIDEIAAERGDIIFRKPDFVAFISADKNRFTQACENIVNNARKYAKTDIEVFFTKENDDIILHFCDHGDGIPDENMPFIFDKFYRGNNCGNEQGSGLGLYIVKYITERMGGKVVLQNRDKGLEVKLILPTLK